MHTLFMSLVSFSDKTRRKTDLERSLNHLQHSFAHDTIISLLYGSHHRGISQLPFCDNVADGTCGPYDDDGEPE